MAEHQNGIVWCDVMTKNQDAAGLFYADVLGGTIDQGFNAPNGYRMIAGPGEAPGGAWIINGLDPQGAMFNVTGSRV
jgi:predicted enzyme related to lactoylglutathione lyase